MKSRKLWDSNATISKADYWGTMQGKGAAKITLHDDGVPDGSARGALSWVHQKHHEYHVIIDSRTTEYYQMIPFNGAAMSLKNGGINSPYGCNKSGRVNIQICIISHGQSLNSNLTPWAVNIIKEIAKSWDVPLIVINSGRSEKAWLTRSGIFGHKNAPGNGHTDPGHIPQSKFDTHVSDSPKKRVYSFLRKGDEGRLVKKLQTALEIHVDGKFGDGTERAVRRFQRLQGLESDGVVGRSTWKALGYKYVRPVTRILKRGSKGLEVRKLQRALKLKTDGQFGRKTKRAVQKIQRKNKLYPDGVVGPKTWKALGIRYKKPKVRGSLTKNSNTRWPTNKNLMKGLRGIANELNMQLHIVSGYRSFAEQSRLYNGWIRRLPGFNLAAPPGSSAHNYGNAADVGVIVNGKYISIGNYAPARRLLAKYGLRRTVRDSRGNVLEQWHVSYVGK